MISLQQWVKLTLRQKFSIKLLTQPMTYCLHHLSSGGWDLHSVNLMFSPVFHGISRSIIFNSSENTPIWKYLLSNTLSQANDRAWKANSYLVPAPLVCKVKAIMCHPDSGSKSRAPLGICLSDCAPFPREVSSPEYLLMSSNLSG